MFFWCLIKKKKAVHINYCMERVDGVSSCTFQLGNICEPVHKHKCPKGHQATVTTHKRQKTRRWCVVSTASTFNFTVSCNLNGLKEKWKR
jgi:hypothetical protein